MFEIFLILLAVVIGIIFVGYLIYSICICCGLDCGRYHTGAYYYKNEVKAAGIDCQGPHSQGDQGGHWSP